VLISAVVLRSASANCMGEIEGPFPNQIGTVMLFSSRDGGPKHPSIPSEFWAVTGQYDFRRTYIYPVRFTEAVSRIIDTWNWRHLSFNPPIITVVVDGEFDGDLLWITVKELLLDESQINAAYEKYPEARGRCPPLFRLR